MKSNLAILSSDIKSINFVIKNKLENNFNLYANSSRNIKDAELFSKKYSFSKYYGSYEELIDDKNIEYVINFLPSGIKFEYTYLLIKKGLKVITNFPVISVPAEIDYLNEIRNSHYSNNLFMVDEVDIKSLKRQSENKKYLTYFKNVKLPQREKNSLSNQDILFECCPDLLFYLDTYKHQKIQISNIDLKRNNLTNSIEFFRCIIEINSDKKLFIILDSNSVENNHLSNIDINSDLKEENFYNFEEFKNYIILKKPFDNLSYFQYDPLKLLQEAINE